MHPFDELVGGESTGTSHLVGCMLCDKVVEISDALDTSFKVRASQAFVAQVQLENLTLIFSLIFTQESFRDAFDSFDDQLNLFFPDISEGLIRSVQKAALDCLMNSAAIVCYEISVEHWVRHGRDLRKATHNVDV